MKIFLKKNYLIIFSAFVLILIGTGGVEYVFLNKQSPEILKILLPPVLYALILASFLALIFQVLAWRKDKNILLNISLLIAAFSENIFLIILPFFPSAGSQEIGYSLFVLCAVFVIFLLLVQLIVWFIFGVRKMIK